MHGPDHVESASVHTFKLCIK